MKVNSRKWILEKEKYKTPVNQNEIRKGAWSNVTRKQTVDVVDVKVSSELGVKIVEYYWKDCPIAKYYYFKPLTQFLRSYERI